MSKWTHSMCEVCYQILEPDRLIVRLINPDLEACCRCSQGHQSGIYYRAHPDMFPCKGMTVTHEE